MAGAGGGACRGCGGARGGVYERAKGGRGERRAARDAIFPHYYPPSQQGEGPLPTTRTAATRLLAGDDRYVRAEAGKTDAREIRWPPAAGVGDQPSKRLLPSGCRM